MYIDERLYKRISSLARKNVLLDALFVFGARDLIFAMVISGVIYLLVNQNHELFYLFSVSHFVAAIVFAWFVTFILQNSFHRTRPHHRFEQKPLFELLFHSPSFPSGHATISFAIATAMWLFFPQVGLLFIALAIWVSFSRVFVGVHYPSDILVGAFIGFLVSYLVL